MSISRQICPSASSRHVRFAAAGPHCNVRCTSNRTPRVVRAILWVHDKCAREPPAQICAGDKCGALSPSTEAEMFGQGIGLPGHHLASGAAPLDTCRPARARPRTLQRPSCHRRPRPRRWGLVSIPSSPCRNCDLAADDQPASLPSWRSYGVRKRHGAAAGRPGSAHGAARHPVRRAAQPGVAEEMVAGEVS